MPNRRARATRANARVARVTGGKRRKRKVLPRQIYPKGIQLSYSRELLKIVRLSRTLMQPLLDRLPALLASSASDQRFDAGEGKDITSLIEAAQVRMVAVISQPQLEALASEFATRTATWQRVQLLKQTRAALGVDVFINDAGLRAASEAFVEQNVSLIKNLTTKTYSDIEMLVQREVQAGTLHKDIAKQIGDKFAIGERRAKLIARDQVGKFHGKVNETRQRELGVERFIWRTSQDERVRAEHVARDGSVYSWDNAPEGGPGAPINCRCNAEAIFEDLIEDPPDIGSDVIF